MKLLLEKWRKYLIERIFRDDIIKTRGEGLVIFPSWAKEHIEGSHKEVGKGSVFQDFDLNLINHAISEIDVPDEGQDGIFVIEVPGVGYNLVLPAEEAGKLPDARMTTTKKEEQGKILQVPAILTTAPLEQFLTNTMTVVIRKTEKMEFVPQIFIQLSQAGQEIQLHQLANGAKITR